MGVGQPASSATVQPTSMDRAYEKKVVEKYARLCKEYKHAIIGEYFTETSLGMTTSVFQWYGPGGMKGAEEEPVTRYLSGETQQLALH